MGRLMGLDIGERRIGIALSDEGRRIASPHSVLSRVGWGPDTKAICELFAREGCDAVVCGLPRNMNGSAGFQAEEVRLFAQQLEKRGLTVLWMDERLTTVAAEHALIEGGMRREDRKKHVDKVAAAIILQRYLDQTPSEKGAAMTNDLDPREVNPEEETENDLIELTDEDGVSSMFEYLTTIELEGKQYIVLMPQDQAEDEDSEEAEVVLLEIQQDENGEDVYVTIEDDAVADKVFEEFLRIAEEMDEDGEE